MATMSLFRNLFEDCNNMICVESDEEHLSDLTKSRYHFSLPR